RGDAVYTVEHVKWKPGTLWGFSTRSSTGTLKVHGGVELSVPHVRAVDMGLSVPSGLSTPTPTTPMQMLDADLGLAMSHVETLQTGTPLAGSTPTDTATSPDVLGKVQAVLKEVGVLRDGRDGVPSDINLALQSAYSDEALRAHYGGSRRTPVVMVIKTPGKF